MSDFSIESLGKTPFFLDEFLVDAQRNTGACQPYLNQQCKS
jgi:hypothetical protein